MKNMAEEAILGRDGSIRRHRLSADEYQRMSQAGILAAEAHVELIEGEIIDMPARGSRHAGTTAHLLRILSRAVGDSAVVWVQDPIHLDAYSEPEPDLAVLRPRADFYKSQLPTSADVLLLIEVAGATVGYDRDVKGPLYARNGIPEFWIVDLERQALLRYRRPESGAYASADEIDVRETVAISSVPGATLDLRGVFL
jgi:Uma2 family endonuclease